MGRYRSLKSGTRAPSFCGDHTNSPALAHGPTTLPVVSYVQPLPDLEAGFTWDGGPSSIGVRLELLTLGEPRPMLSTIGNGSQDPTYFAGTPFLTTSDESSMAITELLDRVISPRVPLQSTSVSSVSRHSRND